ncbi:AbrB/MazE/SpoVT family DNA-binding domain-containing protein [Enterocloster clostridioformis]|nr:AbrB/MazE/SpoVT family DNA-binding domain-containing protein [Enterocloster clostridioformis]
MMTAKLFENGRSQAVRLPKEYRFQGDEVLVTQLPPAKAGGLMRPKGRR